METEKISKRRTAKHQRMLMFLLAFAFALLLLAVASSAKPAYAASPPQMVLQPEMMPPPEDGDGFTYSANTIEGQVCDRTTILPIANVDVFLFDNMSTAYTATDSNGYFKFTQAPGLPAYIQPNSRYTICLNGPGDGSWVDNVRLGQWIGYFHTGSSGNAARTIYLQSAAIVKVPIAALYSNTPYNQLMEYQHTFYHDVSFRCTVGGTGFLSSSPKSYSYFFKIYGQNDTYLGKRYYAVGCYDERISSLTTSGLSAEYDIYENMRQYGVSEYLTPNASQPNYGLPTNRPQYVDIYGNSSWGTTFTESGSTTWEFGFSGSVGINVNFFGVSLNIDCTVSVTSGYTNTMSFQVLLPAGAPLHRFLYYTRGFNVSQNGMGGPELHLWDLGVVT